MAGTICPFCGAYSVRSCEFEGGEEGCPWDDLNNEPDLDPDYLREIRDGLAEIGKREAAEAELARLREPVGEVGGMVKRLTNPPFGTETSERNLMQAAADLITRLAAEIEENEGVIRVWRRRTETAEASLREAVKAGRALYHEQVYENRDVRRGVSVEFIMRLNILMATLGVLQDNNPLVVEARAFIAKMEPQP